ncbi:MAG: hypothetical protein ACPLPR_09835 [Bacillota bacterium]
MRRPLTKPKPAVGCLRGIVRGIIAQDLALVSRSNDEQPVKKHFLRGRRQQEY